MVATKLLTVEDLERMGNDARHTELVNGVLIEMSPSNDEHGTLAADLIGFLLPFVRTRRLGKVYTAEAGFVVARNPDSVLAPDVAFVSAARLAPDRRRDTFVPFAPDLAVEIESPSNSLKELHRKAMFYLDGGSRLVWLIRPGRRTVVVFRPNVPEQVLTEADTLRGEDVIPGFSLSLRELFEDALD